MAYAVIDHRLFLIVAASAFLAVGLLRLALIDHQTGRLPDRWTLPLIVAGLLINTVIVGGIPTAAVWGALLGYGAFWAIGTAFYHLRGTEGLGLGDAKLFAASGAWLGVWMLPSMLLVAALTGLFVAVCSNSPRAKEIRFGPYLAASFLLHWMALICYGMEF
jgi:leader peptidase (prepilin peptidase)/N-methyltransferase